MTNIRSKSQRHSRLFTLPWIGCFLLLAACGGSGGRVAAISDLLPGSAPSAERSRHAVEEAMTLLQDGKQEAARKKLVKVLKDNPNYPAAANLLREIDSDPRELLGKSFEHYTVATGESFATIAQKTLGDSMMFYALARFNGYDRPNALVPGQSILVPQKERRAAKKPAPKAVVTKVVTKEVAEKPPQKVARKAPTQTASPAQTANPAKAKAFRASALTALNNGAVDKAINLLRLALNNDPDNSLIKDDLGRAMRIRKSLGGR
jgi:tetratricopeptide (TPR) repeat protein